jgi:hypothetical protein
MLSRVWRPILAQKQPESALQDKGASDNTRQVLVAGGAETCGGPGTSALVARKPYPSVYDVERTFGVTWGQLVNLTPELETLLWQARKAGGKWRTFADVNRIFGPLRNELAELIGFAGKHREHPLLGSTAAYEVAYWKLYDAVAGLLPSHAANTTDSSEKPRAV